MTRHAVIVAGLPWVEDTLRPERQELDLPGGYVLIDYGNFDPASGNPWQGVRLMHIGCVTQAGHWPTIGQARQECAAWLRPRLRAQAEVFRLSAARLTEDAEMIEDLL